MTTKRPVSLISGRFAWQSYRPSEPMSPPDLDVDHIQYGKRLLPQVLDSDALRSPSRVFAMQLASRGAPQGFRKLTIGDFARAVDYVAFWIVEKIGASTTFEVIAYFGLNDFRYFVMEIAAMKCGYTLLLPSIRNSDANNSALFKVTNCNKAFYSTPLGAKVANLNVQPFCVPLMEEMTAGSPQRKYPYDKTWDEARSDPVAICHTSGSTGDPKPIFYNHAFLGTADSARNLPAPEGRRDGNISLLDGTMNYFGFPPFHLMGLFYGLNQLFYHSTLVLPPAEVPGTGKIMMDILKEVSFQALVSPPNLLDEIVKDHAEEFLQHTQSLRIIHNAGGPLNKTTGDFLSQRFDIVQIIGQSETAKLPNLVANRETWQYYEWNPLIGGIHMDRVDGTDDLYELTIRKQPDREWAQGVFMVFPDLSVWRTRDTYRKHPSKDLYLFEGRIDDVIVLNNGEKFNPVSMEGSISSHPLLTGALVVGTGYNQAALILECREGDGEKIIEQVWPSIEKANHEAPTHARIYKHMVMTTSADKPFRRAAKGTIQRDGSVKDYADEIAALYSKARGSLQRPAANRPKLQVPKASIAAFVHQAVADQLHQKSFVDSDDLYLMGFDSLQTTELAKTLSEGLGPLAPSLAAADMISPRLVYDNPSAEKITDALHAIFQPETRTNGVKPYDVDHMAWEKIQQLVSKYTSGLRRPIGLVNHLPPRTVAEKGLHVVVTGTTGFLGYYLLLTLLQEELVGRVTCLNRSPVAEDKFLTELGIHKNNTNPSATEKLNFVQVSFGEPRLGLSEMVFENLVNDVDIVIHNAWTVDFNRNLSSFEDPHLVGLRTLIEWALLSPCGMHIHFVSSISTVAHWPGYWHGKQKHGLNNEPSSNEKWNEVKVLEEVPNPSRIPARQFGYAQSKYVAESILAKAASSHNVPVTILRPGQISDSVITPGPRSHETEWFPLLIKTSKNMKMLPETVTRTGLVDFIPVDQLAKVIVDIATTSDMRTHIEKETQEANDNASVFNLVNPCPVPFAELIPCIESRFANDEVENVGIVSLKQWVKELANYDRNDVSDVETYPALKLLGFFEGLTDEDGERTTVKVETGKPAKLSETMSSMRPIKGSDVVAWLEGWDL